MYNAAAFLFIALAGAIIVLTAFLVLDPARAAALIPAQWRPAEPLSPSPSVSPPDAAETPGAQAAPPAAGTPPGDAAALAPAATPEDPAAAPPGGTPAATVPAGTATPGPTATPTNTPRPSPTPREGIAEELLTGTPGAYTFAAVEEPRYTAYAGPEGCEYLAIAGQVMDDTGRPLLMVPVLAEGDAFFSALDFSGNAPRYGTAGYEIFINDRPYEDTFTVQLVSETGVALSEPVEVRTSSLCGRNVVIVDFRATAPLGD